MESSIKIIDTNYVHKKIEQMSFDQSNTESMQLPDMTCQNIKKYSSLKLVFGPEIMQFVIKLTINSLPIGMKEYSGRFCKKYKKKIRLLP